MHVTPAVMWTRCSGVRGFFRLGERRVTRGYSVLKLIQLREAANEILI